MAKKQEAEKELLAQRAELPDAEENLVKERENIESEADSNLIDEIKSNTWATPKGDIDWDEEESDFGNYTPEERARLEEQYAATLSSISRGEIVSGTVVSINNKDVVLNIGFKSDGLVSSSEFRDMPDLKVGDTVDVFVESQEDAQGQLVLS